MLQPPRCNYGYLYLEIVEPQPRINLVACPRLIPHCALRLDSEELTR